MEHDSPLVISEEDGRVSLALIGGLTADRLDALKEAVEAGKKAIEAAYHRTGARIDTLFDLSGFTGEYAIEAMDIMADFARRDTPFVRRTAAFGAPSMKGAMAGEVTAAFAGRENIKFFRTKDEALAWLES